MFFFFYANIVDASEAGSGNIEIMVNKGRIACNVQNLGSYKFLASFVPTKPEKHNVEMKFNNLPVIGNCVSMLYQKIRVC